MSLSKIFNLLARSFLIFIVSYMWLSFYIRDIIFVFLISFSLTFAINLIYHLLITKNRIQKLPANLKLPTRYQISTPESKICIYPFFKCPPTETQLSQIARDTTARIYIAAKSFSPQTKRAAKSKKIHLITYKSRLHMLLHLVKFTAFKKRRVRGYIFMGLVILATSFLVRFNIYYIVIATVMFSFAIISLFELPFTRDNPFTR